MIAVIFEVEPKMGRADEYFETALDLKPILEKIDGFISVERFESLVLKGKYLSLSFWRNEEALQSWRNVEKHRAAQSLGREELFDNYRIRISSVLRDYTMTDRTQVPKDSLEIHG